MAPPRQTPPETLLAVGPALFGLYDVVDPPLFPADDNMLASSIAGVGALCAALAALQLARGGLQPLRLVPLGIAVVLAVALMFVSPFDPVTFWEEAELRVGPAAVFALEAVFIALWRPTPHVTATAALTVVALLGQVLAHPVRTEWLVAVSLDEGWGPFGPQTVARLALDLGTPLLRVADGAPLLVVVLLLLAQRSSKDAAEALA